MRDMAQEDKRSDKDGEPGDDATLLKKRARRRLIGAVALALLAAIILPMVMDHQPAPLLKDIQVRIPSPDEGVTQRVTGKLAAVQQPAHPAPVEKPEAKPVVKVEPKTEAKPVAKAEPKPEAQAAEPKSAAEKIGGEAWEVQLGAYQNPASVTILIGKLKQLDLPTYTEKVDTPNGPRTRVRAGPFPTQEAAEKARARVKIIGVDGPVARK
ncbi:MAG: SPOR domain-containing protein [Rhodocyclaceae bacterium]|jgi:DedD protein|nr:SPOR domain-containing protein [Rhodocyclaceae bacterium]